MFSLMDKFLPNCQDHHLIFVAIGENITSGNYYCEGGGHYSHGKNSGSGRYFHKEEKKHKAEKEGSGPLSSPSTKATTGNHCRMFIVKGWRNERGRTNGSVGSLFRWDDTDSHLLLIWEFTPGYPKEITSKFIRFDRKEQSNVSSTYQINRHGWSILFQLTFLSRLFQKIQQRSSINSLLETTKLPVSMSLHRWEVLNRHRYVSFVKVDILIMKNCSPCVVPHSVDLIWIELIFVLEDQH